MKTRWKILTEGILVLGLSGMVVAGESAKGEIRLTHEKLIRIEKNLVIALESENLGLQASAAFAIKEAKMYAPDFAFTETVIPLMRILKDEHQSTTARIASALALHDLKSGRGDYAIKRTGRFTEIQPVKHICNALAFERARVSEP